MLRNPLYLAGLVRILSELPDTQRQPLSGRKRSVTVSEVPYDVSHLDPAAIYYDTPCGSVEAGESGAACITAGHSLCERTCITQQPEERIARGLLPAPFGAVFAAGRYHLLIASASGGQQLVEILLGRSCRPELKLLGEEPEHIR